MLWMVSFSKRVPATAAKTISSCKNTVNSYWFLIEQPTFSAKRFAMKSRIHFSKIGLHFLFNLSYCIIVTDQLLYCPKPQINDDLAKKIDIYSNTCTSYIWISSQEQVLREFFPVMQRLVSASKLGLLLLRHARSILILGSLPNVCLQINGRCLFFLLVLYVRATFICLMRMFGAHPRSRGSCQSR